MACSQREWDQHCAVEPDPPRRADIGESSNKANTDDGYPEDVTTPLLGLSGILGLLVLLAVVVALGAVTALLRYW